MADIYSPARSLTVQLPEDVIGELRTVAETKKCSVDEVVLEACLAYTEPYLWEREYKKCVREKPEGRAEFGIDGDDLLAPDHDEKKP